MTPRHMKLAMEGYAAFQAADPLGAARSFAAALDLAPRDPTIATNLGHAWFATGDFEAAAAAYERAVELSPELGAAWTGLGNARRRLDDPTSAIDAYRRAIAQGAEDASTLNGLGIALKDDGQLASAEEAYRSALVLAPSAALYVNLGNALGDQGRRDEAVAAYESALALDPSSAEAHFNLFGAVYDVDPARAEASLRSAIAARPGFTSARFHLGALCRLADREEEASDLLEEAPPHLLSSLAFVRRNSLESAHSRRPRFFTDAFALLEAALAECRVEGTVIELGVRRGTSINFIAGRVGNREVQGFDSFEGLPTTWGSLSAGAYSTRGALPDVAPNVVLHVGWFQDTLGPFARKRPNPIRFMNVDSDLYSSAAEAFRALGRLLVEGSVVVFDEYLANPGWENEEHRALLEASRDHGFSFDYLAFSLFSRQAAILVKKPA